MCDDKKTSQKIHEDGILMLLFPGDLDWITWMVHQIPSEGEKILIQGPRQIQLMFVSLVQNVFENQSQKQAKLISIKATFTQSMSDYIYFNTFDAFGLNPMHIYFILYL